MSDVGHQPATVCPSVRRDRTPESTARPSSGCPLCRTMYGRQLPRARASNAADEWRQFRGRATVLFLQYIVLLLRLFCSCAALTVMSSLRRVKYRKSRRLYGRRRNRRDSTEVTDGVPLGVRRFAAAAVRPALFTVRKICVVKFKLFHSYYNKTPINLKLTY